MLRTLALAMIAVTLGACGEHEKLARYREPRDGWTVSYPVSMIPRAIGYGKGMLSDRGVIISSSPRVRVTDEAAFRRFPREAVAFGLFRSFGGPLREQARPESRSRSTGQPSRRSQQLRPRSSSSTT